APRHQAQDVGFASRWVQDARQHFNGGGLARAVWTDERQQLARFDAQVDARDGFDIAIARRDQTAETGFQAGGLFAGAEELAQAARLDGGRHAPSLTIDPRVRQPNQVFARG